MIGLKQVGSSAERKIKKQYEIGVGLSRLLLVSVLLGFTGSVIQPIYLVDLQDEFTTDLGSLAWAFLPIRVLSRSYGAAVEDGQASG